VAQGTADARYFDYDFATNELRPNPAASIEDQRRAETTIAVLDLNRAGNRKARQRAIPRFRGLTADDLEDEPYRFLIPLVIAS
jgi:hypothetical protein